MRVVVLGGYGVFGSLLAQLLIRDGHELWIAGRSFEKAKVCAERIDARPLVVDVKGDLAPIFAVAPQVVVDAAGPFQAYGDDRYRVARHCIRQGANYLDLSDDADFTSGIAELDSEAHAAGLWALSGASSVPGLSSVVVGELAKGFDEILLIDTAILPGNQAPRGVSVIASIVGQVGTTSSVWRGGMWREAGCWTERQRYCLGTGLKRSGYFINVPDIRLFPDAFGARSVMFRAGMELGIFNAGLAAIGAVRRVWPFRITPGAVRVLQWLSERLLSFGSDRGGMRVAVTGDVGGQVRQREWQLIAEAGEGPFVPGVLARALVRCSDRVAPGARPCICEVGLADIEAAMSDLAVSTQTSQTDRPTLFRLALGDRWADLPPKVRELHSVQDVESFSGFADVTRGTSALARLAAWFFGFPAEGRNVPLTLTKTRTGAGEIWERNFAGRVFRSYCTPANDAYRYRERFWLFNYEQDLPVADGCLHLPVRRGWFLGLPIPRILLPESNSREFAVDGKFHFDVSLSAPLGGGLIVRYRGSLAPDREPRGTRPDAVQSSRVKDFAKSSASGRC